MENNKRHNTKDEPWVGMGFTPVTLRDPDKPTKSEEIEHTKHVKEKNERFTVCPDNTKKAHSLTHGHLHEAMQMQLENNTDFEGKMKGDPFTTPEKIELNCMIHQK